MQFCLVCARAFLSSHCDALIISHGVGVLICSILFAGSPTCGICAHSVCTRVNDSNGDYFASGVTVVWPLSLAGGLLV